MSPESFELAAGSVTGHEHAGRGRNNQDAYGYSSGPDGIVAVVTDGCGSGRWSEAGARLGARLVVEAVGRRLRQLDSAPAVLVLRDAEQAILATLSRLAREMGGDLPATVADHLLFTVVGAAITESIAIVFSAGDGVIALNGDVQVLRAPGNAPDYLSYGLIGERRSGQETRRLELKQAISRPSLSSLLLGTDGVADLLNVAEHRLPGRREVFGPLRQFWEDDRYFANPDAVARRLRLANRTVHPIDWDARCRRTESPLLPDDTSLIVLRRRRQTAEPQGALA